MQNRVSRAAESPSRLAELEGGVGCAMSEFGSEEQCGRVQSCKLEKLATTRRMLRRNLVCYIGLGHRHLFVVPLLDSDFVVFRNDYTLIERSISKTRLISWISNELDLRCPAFAESGLAIESRR
jgi:hypothetical protein